ncbi:twin-arginine translocation signal domain-containing protein, partial [Thiolapillus sp.]
MDRRKFLKTTGAALAVSG